jgi:hypothetical protein
MFGVARGLFKVVPRLIAALKKRKGVSLRFNSPQRTQSEGFVADTHEWVHCIMS